MPINPVNLNIDPSGYAGSIVQDISAPARQQSQFTSTPFRVPRAGRSSGLASFLKNQARKRSSLEKRAAQNRDAIARAQLKALRQSTRQQGRAAREASRPDRRDTSTRRESPIFGRRQQSQRGRAGILARAMADAPGRAHGLRGPAEVQNLADIIGSIGIPAAHRGMMQTGQLLSAQGRGGVYEGPGQAPQPTGTLEAYGMPIQPEAPIESQAFIGSQPMMSARRPIRPGQVPSYQLKGGSLPKPGPFFLSEPGQFEDGTLPGTLPSNQKAKLHKGEVVLSADQVDEPLMNYLIGDKLRKLDAGQMDGKGTGPGKMASYRHGSDIPGAPIGEPLEANLETPSQGYMGIIPEETQEGLGAMDYLKNFWSAAYGPGEESISTATARVLGGGADVLGRLYGLGGAEEKDVSTGGPPAAGVQEPEAEVPPEPSLSERMLTAAEESREQAPAYELGTKGYIESSSASRDAAALRANADRTEKWLMKSVKGGTVSPEMWKTMTDQINRYDKLADMADKRREKAQAVATGEKQAGEDRIQQAYQTGIQAQLSQDERSQREIQRQYSSVNTQLNKLSDRYFKAEEGSEERNSIMSRLVDAYREREGFTGEEVSAEEAEVAVLLSLDQITQEEAAERLAKLGKYF